MAQPKKVKKGKAEAKSAKLKRGAETARAQAARPSETRLDPRWNVWGKGSKKIAVDALEKVGAKKAARKGPAASVPSEPSAFASPDLEDLVSDTPPAPPGHPVGGSLDVGPGLCRGNQGLPRRH